MLGELVEMATVVIGGGMFTGIGLSIPYFHHKTNVEKIQANERIKKSEIMERSTIRADDYALEQLKHQNRLEDNLTTAAINQTDKAQRLALPGKSRKLAQREDSLDQREAELNRVHRELKEAQQSIFSRSRDLNPYNPYSGRGSGWGSKW